MRPAPHVYSVSHWCQLPSPQTCVPCSNLTLRPATHELFGSGCSLQEHLFVWFFLSFDCIRATSRCDHVLFTYVLVKMTTKCVNFLLGTFTFCQWLSFKGIKCLHQGAEWNPGLTPNNKDSAIARFLPFTKLERILEGWKWILICVVSFFPSNSKICYKTRTL